MDRDPGQGRPTDPNSDSLQRKIKYILDEDARVTVRQLEDLTGAPKSTLFRTLKSMELCKFSARWVPRILTLELNQWRKEACQRNLALVDDCGGAVTFLSRLVTSDESWINERLKKELRGRTFDQRDSLEDEVRRVCHRIVQRDEYTRAMENLFQCWRKCIAVHGDYVEKISADN